MDRSSESESPLSAKAMSSTETNIIYVVDDDPDVLHSTRFLLECEGRAVETFQDGPTLLSAFPGPRPAFVLLDHVMPGMDGLEVAARMRDLDIRVPTVLMTGHPNPAIRRRARAAGIPVVDKPLAFEALQGMLAVPWPHRDPSPQA